MMEIDHPTHYNGDKYECIEVMREVFGDEATKNFCLLNAFKYLWRCGKKHETPYADIAKAIWYLEKYNKLTEGAGTDDEGNSADPAPFPSMVVVYNGKGAGTDESAFTD